MGTYQGKQAAIIEEISVTVGHHRVNQGMAPSEPRPAEWLETPAPEHRKDADERFPSPPRKHAELQIHTVG
jgi:hypothetical protein